MKAVPAAKAVKATATVNATAQEVAASRAVKTMAVNAAIQELAAIRVATAQQVAAARVATALAAQEAAQTRAAHAALAYAEAQERAAARWRWLRRAPPRRLLSLSLPAQSILNRKKLSQMPNASRNCPGSERKRWLGKAAAGSYRPSARRCARLLRRQRGLSSAEVAANVARVATIPGYQKVALAIKGGFQRGEIDALTNSFKRWTASFSGLNRRMR